MKASCTSLLRIHLPASIEFSWQRMLPFYSFLAATKWVSAGLYLSWQSMISRVVSALATSSSSKSTVRLLLLVFLSGMVVICLLIVAFLAIKSAYVGSNKVMAKGWGSYYWAPPVAGHWHRKLGWGGWDLKSPVACTFVNNLSVLVDRPLCTEPRIFLQCYCNCLPYPL